MTFNGFISYSHAADGRLAPAVQRGLHRLAKPWHRRRALWIFRDQTGLSVTPALWSSIQTALDGSEYFVLLASPEAAGSPWVNREIEHWMATKTADRILPVVTDGEWEWDSERHDFTEDSTAVPAALRGVFDEEPLFLDLRWARGSEHLSLQHSRFRDAIAQLAAPMHGVSKDELEGEDVRQHRRARRLRSGAVATLVLLTMLATVTGMSAVRNAERARAAAAEAMRQQQVAEVQRGSAERSAQEALRQQELARQQQDLAQQQRTRATDATAAADEAERLAEKQQKLADAAAAEARRQQRLADRAATRTREQQRLAKEAAERAQRMEKEARRLAKIAQEQRRLAREAAEEADRQQAKADEQQRIAVSRRLMIRAKASIVDDPKTALMLGAAAHELRPDAENHKELAGVITATNYAGSFRNTTWTAYAKDGVLAGLGSDGLVTLWNVTDRRKPSVLAMLGERAAKGGSLLFSPDGRTLAVVGAQDKVVLWDVAVRSRPVRLATLANDGAVRSLAYSADGRTFVTGDLSGITTLWDTSDRAEPELITRLDGFEPYPVEGLAFSPDGRTLIVDKGRFVPVYDMTDPLDPVALRGVVGFGKLPMVFTPDSKKLIVGDYDGTVAYYDIEARRDEIRDGVRVMDDGPQPPDMPPDEPDWGAYDRITSLGGTISAITLSPDGRMMAAGDEDGTVTVWDGRRVISSMQANAGIRTLAFGPGAGTLVTADTSGNATMWNVTPRSAPDRLAALAVAGGSNRATVFGPDGRTLLAAGSDGRARTWKVTDPARPVPGADLTVHSGAVRSVAFSADGRTVAAVGSDDGRLTVSQVSRPDRSVTLTVLPKYVLGTNAMAFSPDGRTLAVVADNTATMLWDLTDRKRPVLRATLGGNSFGTALAFSPDGRTLAAGGEDRTLTLWNVVDRSRPIRVGGLNGHSDFVESLAFTADGRTLASAGFDSRTILWDVTDGGQAHRLAILGGHSGGVESVAFSPDGRTMATGGRDNTVNLWDTARPAEPIRVATIPSGLAGEAREVTFRRDGQTLAVTGQSRDAVTVTLWSYAKLNSLRNDPAGYACAIAGRGFSPSEWARHIPELAYRRTCAG
ncbi:TIR domain-containing protein [Actinoplanes sp. NPDC048791]|uniref:TIR domain-containing protein n=1 Tax=Actinoplanes sp. NPDC048791 TaxID=3154623 RepID=UPI00340975D2